VGNVSWFENPGNPTTVSSWVEHVIDSGIDSSHNVAVADIDLDGRLDVVVSEFRGTGRLLVYHNNGGATSWTSQVLGTTFLHNIVVGDYDNDGDTDIFGVGPFGVLPVEVWRNETRMGPSFPTKVLVFHKTLEFYHGSIEDGRVAIRSIGAMNNFLVDDTTDSTVFTDAILAQYSAIVFLSPSGEILDTNQLAAFQRFIESGKGFVGIHNAAAYVLVNSDWYTQLVGTRFESEIYPEPMTLQVLNHTHPSTARLPDTWSWMSHVFNFNPNPKVNGVTVLVNLDETSVTGGTMGPDHPWTWYHPYDGGRAWYTAGGADSEDFYQPAFRDHIAGGIQYAIGPRGGEVPSFGTISLSMFSYSVNENGGTVTITATRTGGSSGAVGVSYATSNGTALAGSDYIAANGTLSWADGNSTSKVITVSLFNDALIEGPETFTVTLSNATGGATLGTPSSATVTIVDDESPGSISLSASAYSVNENGGTVTITATRTGGSSGAVGVSYKTSNGTAMADSDYVTSIGTLSWADGDTANKTFTVTILDDTAVEGNETFTVTLSNPTGGATLQSPSSATVTILDNDSFGTIALSASSYSVNENGGTVTITATRTGGSSGAVGVSYATSNGTALAGSDYVAANGTLSWADGEAASKTFSVSILDDTIAEGNETFTVTLSSPTGGSTLGSPSVATVTIVDNDGSVQTTGLQLWLKADAGVTLAGTAVSQWADQSGNSRNATQGTASSQPTLVSNALNGKPALSFDGVNDFMTFTFPVNGLTGMTLVLVGANSADKNGGSTNAESSAIFWNETSSWGTVYLSPYQTNVKFRFGTGQTGNLPSYTRPTSIGSGFSISVATKNGTTDSLYVNGNLAVSQSGKLSTIAVSQSTGNLGRGYNNNTYFPGRISEVLVYNRALSDSERQGVEAYLNSKYFP